MLFIKYINWVQLVGIQIYNSCSCSKLFCWAVYKFSKIYLGYAEDRTLNTVKQHDKSSRQVTSVSFVVLKQAAGNFCGCNWDSTVMTRMYILAILRISLLSVIYLPSSGTCFKYDYICKINKTLKSIHEVCSNPPPTNPERAFSKQISVSVYSVCPELN